ncbi:MAG: HYC_CC_PP family protein [Luteibaculum sp.]
MRKALAILLSFTLFLFSSGLLISMHFCQEELVDVAVYNNAASCCCDDIGTPADCCSEEQVVLKLQEEISKPEQEIKPAPIKALPEKVKNDHFLLPSPAIDFTQLQEKELPPEDLITRLHKWILYA